MRAAELSALVSPADPYENTSFPEGLRALWAGGGQSMGKTIV